MDGPMLIVYLYGHAHLVRIYIYAVLFAASLVICIWRIARRDFDHWLPVAVFLLFVSFSSLAMYPWVTIQRGGW